MICIRPIAPLDDRARCFAPLSTCSTARIQCSGTPKRFDASVTNAAKGRTDNGRRVADDSCAACAAPLDSIDAAKTAAARDGLANLVRDGGMVRVLTEQRNDRRLPVLRQGHFSSPVQRGSAVPMIALVG